MDKVIWLVAGNKGGVGKSVVAKSLVEWLKNHDVPITVVDGDQSTPDVANVFKTTYKTMQFDLHETSEWPHYLDAICHADIEGHVITNLPDSLDGHMLEFVEKFTILANGYGFRIKILFVMNTLPDGLCLFARLVDSLPNIIPVKNLYFGAATAFTHFDNSYGNDYMDQTILFPCMNPRIMQIVRESNLSFSDFMQQTENSESNFIYAKIIVSDWFESMLEAFDDFLLD